MTDTREIKQENIEALSDRLSVLATVDFMCQPAAATVPTEVQ